MPRPSEPFSVPDPDADAWRVMVRQNGILQAKNDPYRPPEPAPYLDRSLAGPSDGVEIIEIGNPYNPGMRREWERKEGTTWPKTETGRNYDVAHIRALADGGKNVVENIRPMHPDAHAAEHRANGDQSRWGKRASIARAFGGKVARAFPPLQILSGITGILSGRIRTDSFDNFSSDMMGMSSQQDWREMREDYNRQMDPDWQPGDGEWI